MAARVLRRVVELDAEALGGVPHPARIVEQRARYRHHVGFPGGEDLLGLLWVRDHADGPGLDADLFFYSFRKTDLEAGRRGNLRVRHRGAARDADEIEAGALKLARVGHRIVRPPTALDPVRGVDADTQRTLLRPDLAHGARDLH